MAERENLRFRKGDWLAIGLVICLAVAVFSCFLPGRNEPAAYAEVYLDGQLVKTVSLNENQTFVVDFLSNAIMDYYLRFLASHDPLDPADCRKKLQFLLAEVIHINR